jgi:predicted nucleotidyltransferase
MVQGGPQAHHHFGEGQADGYNAVMAPPVVNWGAGQERRARLEAELRRLLPMLPRLGVTRAILFGSMASGEVGQTSDLDLILVAPSTEPFVRRLARFSEALAPSVALDLFVYTPSSRRWRTPTPSCGGRSRAAGWSMRPDPRAEGLRWLRQAEHDLDDAQYSHAGRAGTAWLASSASRRPRRP